MDTSFEAQNSLSGTNRAVVVQGGSGVDVDDCLGSADDEAEDGEGDRDGSEEEESSGKDETSSSEQRASSDKSTEEDVEEEPNLGQVSQDLIRRTLSLSSFSLALAG